MGLPSGLLWADRNLGAKTPQGYGRYVSWGNVDAHAYGSGYDFSLEVYNTTPAAEITANLTLSQDAARANLGAPWRMPTAYEFNELYNNCTYVWTTLNGVNGCLFTSKVNGNTLFFPAAGDYNGKAVGSRGSFGFYWSSTYLSATSARNLSVSSSYVNPLSNDYGRSYGFSVRAVAKLSTKSTKKGILIEDTLGDLKNQSLEKEVDIVRNEPIDVDETQ